MSEYLKAFYHFFALFQFSGLTEAKHEMKPFMKQNGAQLCSKVRKQLKEPDCRVFKCTLEHFASRHTAGCEDNTVWLQLKGRTGQHFHNRSSFFSLQNGLACQQRISQNRSRLAADELSHPMTINLGGRQKRRASCFLSDNYLSSYVHKIHPLM